ncbi:hypothetical protein [Neptunomonas phycophila]|uniref:hypothetical protein n=1 Tax=Neptunomonas phycophila TaxID=1572645 RepID=UPI0015BF08D2|nr:hypothetical protein [Neptunomonas phycophila]QLE97278.1 hypothetical protein FLM49_06370 [Neptunomonas phycophila]
MTFDVDQGYIRHPTDIPAKIALCSDYGVSRNTCSESGVVGISIVTREFFSIDTALDITISISDPAFTASGHVAWCIPDRNGHYRTGIVFDDPETAYGVRMIEQICYIEQYRQQIQKQEGRTLSQADAAEEWISRFAKDFPGFSLTAPAV